MLCTSCFCELVESKIRDAIRPLDLAHQPVISFFDDGSAAAAVTREMLKAIFGKAHTVIKATSSPAPGCLMPFSMEEICAQGIRYFFEQEGVLHLAPCATEGVLMKDLERYCELNKIKFTKRIAAANSFLEQMHRTDPQTYPAFLRSLHEIQEKTEKKNRK